MKLIQINIWFGKLGFPLMDFLKEEQPDIVCMQEVSHIKGHVGPLFATLDEILEAASLPHIALAPLFAHTFMKRQYQFCNAVASKLPFLSNQVVFTAGEYTEDFDEEGQGSNISNFQDVSLKFSDKKLHILNHHGHFVPGSKDGNDETMRQMQILADRIDSLSEPLIVCGDFNLVPDSPSLEPINRRLINLPVKYGIKNTYAPINIHKVVCDYIFVSKEVKVTNFQVSEKLVSDHKALILEFDL